jgi:hypothetical protein
MTGLCAAALAALPLATSGTAQQESASLRFVPRKKFDLVLPTETWIPAQGIAIPHQGGDAFATEKDGLRLRVDTDGDGQFDARVQGAEGYLVLQGKRQDGQGFAYAVRFRQSGENYEYGTSGVMSGSLRGVSIDLIDADCDGRFGEVGVDAMIVGGGRAASFHSEVVELGGELLRIEVSPDGTEIRASPFDGASGTLRVRGGLSLPGKLVSAVVSDSSGRYSFEVGGAAEVRVPIGSYKLTGGFATAGGDTARLRAGEMAALEVTEGGVASLAAWGAPLVAEFDHARAGDTVTVHPFVRFIGRGGEEWYQLLPDAKSPKLEFIDTDRNRVLDSKRFEGC